MHSIEISLLINSICFGYVIKKSAAYKGSAAYLWIEIFFLQNWAILCCLAYPRCRPIGNIENFITSIDPMVEYFKIFSWFIIYAIGFSFVFIEILTNKNVSQLKTPL